MSCTIYSVMQSDGKSYGGYVVFYNFNMVYRDKDSICDQKYDKQIFWNLHYKILKYNND